MNIFKTTFACVLIFLCLCSCVKTPASLKNETTKSATQSSLSEITRQENDIDPRPENTLQEQISPVERGDLNAIRSQLSLDLQKTYKNITVTRARVGEAEVMPVYDIKIGRNPDYDFSKFIERLYSDRFDCSNKKYNVHRRKGDLVDPNDKLPPHDKPTYYKEKGIFSGINVLSINIDRFTPDYDNDPTLGTYLYSIGNVWGSQTGGGTGKKVEDWYDYRKYNIYKRYDLDAQTPAEDEVYTMQDGQEWNVCEAIDFMEAFWAEYIAPSDPADYTYSVKTLLILELGDDKYGYLFAMQKQDEFGNYLDADETSYYFSDKDTIPNGESFIYPNRLYAYCAQKEVLNQFNKDFSFSYEKAQDQGDNLLSLGAAMDKLSEALAPNIGLKLTAELNYVVMCKGYPYFQIWEYPYFYEHVCLTECDFEIRPVWCFRLENQCYLMDKFGTERYYVDAVTGEVSTMVRGIYKKGEKVKQNGNGGW